jgi:hypothetical protein
VKPIDRDFGIPGMLRTALWLDSVCGLEILNIGRPALCPADCVLEIVGSQLHIVAALKGSWIWLSAGSLDAGESTDPICNFPDSAKGWCEVRRLVQALERSGIRSLHPRPLKIGESGSPDCYVIDY